MNLVKYVGLTNVSGSTNMSDSPNMSDYVIFPQTRPIFTTNVSDFHHKRI